jgi:hypothetical protein
MGNNGFKSNGMISLSPNKRNTPMIKNGNYE